MISRVLVPMDDSEMAERALKYALEAHPEAEITVLHVVGTPSPMGGMATGLALSDNLEESAEEYATDVFERAREIAEASDREIDTDVQLGHPARAIINQSDEYDTVVIGTHSGTIADRLFVGNIAEKVVRGAAVPVTVTR